MSHESKTGWLPKDAVSLASVADWPGHIYTFVFLKPWTRSAAGVPASATVKFTPRDKVGHDVRQGGGVGCSLGLYLAVRGTLHYRVEYADGSLVEHTFDWAELRAHGDRSLSFVVDPGEPVVDSLYFLSGGPEGLVPPKNLSLVDPSERVVDPLHFFLHGRLDPPRPFGIVWCSGNSCAEWVPDPSRSDP